MIFFENIKTFFVENTQNIIAWLTPANLAAVITAIIMAIKSSRATKKNTIVGTNLESSLQDIDSIKDTINENTSSSGELKDKLYETDVYVKSLGDKVSKLEDKLVAKYDEIQDKILAMLDVQSLVYNTIQNDELRNNVQNIIANAKFVTDDTRNSLKDKIAELKEQICTMAETAKNAVEKSEAAVEAITDNTVAARY